MNEAEETYSLLPLEECAVHPSARIRFDYANVEELAESLRAVGQVQPGKAVLAPPNGVAGAAGAKYLVYIGCRRFYACRKAGLRSFKAIVVNHMEEGRLQRELLTENVKRANLSVLEELNLFASYYRNHHSLEALAGDIGLTVKRAKERVALAVLIQDKGLIESLYKIERISEFRFTHRHIERLVALEEAKWLPMAIQAADHNWKVEEIERMGSKFSLESLLSSLPAWGWQFVPKPSASSQPPLRSSPRTSPETQEGVRSAPGPKEHEVEEEANRRDNSPSRYQTVARFAQFLICPECGSENVIEIPWYPDAIMFRPGRPEKAMAGAVPLGKEAITLRSALLLGTCTNEKCGEELEIMLDQRNDGTVLTSKREFFSMLEKKLEPRDSGRGSLIWDDVEGVWLKCIPDGAGGHSYFGYDEGARKWVVPVSIGVPAAKVRLE